MSEALFDFIRRRRGEIAQQRNSLRVELNRLEVEDQQLEAAERAAKAAGVMGAFVRRVPPPPPPPPMSPAHVIPLAVLRAPRGAIKRAVVKTLEQHSQGLDAMSILREMNERDGTNYERTSLSPQLSRLKADGIVSLEGNTWRLVGNPLTRPSEFDDDEPDETSDSEVSIRPKEDGNPDAGTSGLFGD